MSAVKVDKVKQYKSNVWYFVTNGKFFIDMSRHELQLKNLHWKHLKNV